MNEIKNFINPNSITDIQCTTINSDGKCCTSKQFTQQFKIKKVSKFQSGDGQEGVIILPIYVCPKCGKELDFKAIK
jgi:hypothetical protein